MCALAVNKKGWGKKTPEEKLRRLPLWTKSKRRKEALLHIRERKRNRCPLPPRKGNYAWNEAEVSWGEKKTDAEGRAGGGSAGTAGRTSVGQD